MSTTVTSLGIDRLSVEERLILVQQIWDSIAAHVEAAPFTEAQQHEIDWRLADNTANPESAIPWEQIEGEALARLQGG